MPEYVCRDLSVPDGGHGVIAPSAVLWIVASTGLPVTWRTHSWVPVAPTCPRCGRQIGATVRNDSSV